MFFIIFQPIFSKRRNLTLDLAPHSSTSSPFYHRRISIGQQKQTLQQASPEHSRLLETPLPRVVASVSSGHQRAFSAVGNPAAPSVSVLPLPPRKPPNRSSHHAADYPTEPRSNSKKAPVTAVESSREKEKRDRTTRSAPSPPLAARPWLAAAQSCSPR